MSRLRLTLLLPALLAAFALASCGGDDGGSGGGSEDVNTLLKETFKEGKETKSGKINVSLKADVKGATGLNGPVSLTLSGPFESQGDKQAPKIALKFAFSGAGQNLSAGLTSTGDKGFVNFNGSDYAVTDEVFAQFKRGYEQANAQNNGKDPSLSSLGINPMNWLSNPKNEGTTKVGDTDTYRITGDVDVPKLLDDLNKTISQASKLGASASGGQIPEQLTDEQKKQAAEAIKDLKVEIYTGKDDKILRRLLLTTNVVPPAGQEKSAGFSNAAVDLDVQLTDVGKGQDIPTPKDPKPFEELAQSLGGLGLGGLGGAGGATGPTGSSGSGSGSGGTSGANSDDVKKYSDCLTKAGSDLDKAQDCAKLLG